MKEVEMFSWLETTSGRPNELWEHPLGEIDRSNTTKRFNHKNTKNLTKIEIRNSPVCSEMTVTIAAMWRCNGNGAVVARSLVGSLECSGCKVSSESV